MDCKELIVEEKMQKKIDIKAILKKLNISELKKIKAGATFSASLINALVRGINSFLDVGRYFGSSIRRFIGGNSCPLK